LPEEIEALGQLTPVRPDGFVMRDGISTLHRRAACAFGRCSAKSRPAGL